MKKLLPIMLAGMLLLGLTSCGSTKTDEFGNEYSVKGSTYTVYLKELPYTINYNGQLIILEDISFYQMDERDNSSTYDLFVIAEFDTFRLDDQNLFWITSDLNGGIRITSEDNEMDNSYGRLLGKEKIEDKNTLVYVFSPSNIVNRHSFVGADITLTLTLKEEEGEYDEIDIIYSATVPEDLHSRSEIRDIYGTELSSDIISWEY